MSTPSNSVNAWILIGEDDPAGTNYDSPNSSYQSLKQNNVYACLDFLCIGFFNTYQTSSTTYPAGDGTYCTIQIADATTMHGNLSNEQYLLNTIADAKSCNPNIKLLATLGWDLDPNYGAYNISRIFDAVTSGKSEQDCADAFTANLVAFLQKYGLDGFDIDWEYDVCSNTTQSQYTTLFTTIRKAFDTYGYYLTLSPSVTSHQVTSTTNTCFDFINLQLYGNSGVGTSFCKAGVNPVLYAYGAKFEPNYGVPYQNANGAYTGMQKGFDCSSSHYTYSNVTQWRLNSNNYSYEQSQQILLYLLVKNISSFEFSDLPIVRANNNPAITSLIIRHGDVVDAIQATNTSSNGTVFSLLQHGGNFGVATTVNIPAGDALATVTGFTGNWYGHQVLAQITLITAKGVNLGTFGSMANVSNTTPFNFTSQAGAPIVAFGGNIIRITEADGQQSYVVGSAFYTVFSY